MKGPLVAFALLAAVPVLAQDSGVGQEKDKAIYFKFSRPAPQAPPAEPQAAGGRSPAQIAFDQKVEAAFRKATASMKDRVVWGNSGSSYNGNREYWNVI